MTKEDMVLANRIRRTLVQHRLDTKKINLTVANGSARLTGVVVRDDGDEVQPATMNVVAQKLDAFGDLRRVAYEFENMIHTGESWVRLGRSRTSSANDRAEDMLCALRIRQILISFRLDAGALNITVASGVARIYGKIQTETHEEISPTVLSAADDKILKIKGLRRCNYEFENMLRTGDVWVPINRRRRRDRREAGGRVEN